MAHVIIEKTTQTRTPEQIRSFTTSQARLPATIMAAGLTGSEEVFIKFSPDQGVTWQDLYVGGVRAKLTATNNVFGLQYPMLISVEKGTTAQPVGVYVSAFDNL